VGQHVDGGVEVLVLGVGEEFAAADVHGGLGLLDEFVNGQDDAGAGDAVVVAFEAGQLAGDLVADRIGDVEVVSADVQLHGNLLTGYLGCAGALSAAALFETLAFAGGGDAHGLAVLGHGAPRHLDALLVEHGGELVVAQGLGGILRADHFFQHGTNGGG